MKKLLLCSLALMMVLGLTACGQEETVEPETTETTETETETEGETEAEATVFTLDGSELAEAMKPTIEKAYANVSAGEIIIGEIIPENFEGYAFVPFQEGIKAVSADPMIGSIPHSVVLIEAEEGVDLEAMAEEILANADTRKWICVEAEKADVAVKGNQLLFVMSDEVTVDTMIANFIAE